MRILILGSDGYIGWALTNHLKAHGHEVYGLDNLIRRSRVEAVESNSIIPIGNPSERFSMYKEMLYDSVRSSVKIEWRLTHIMPDAIVHLAEQPSAPWSMRNSSAAADTQSDNTLSNLKLLWAIKKACPDAHLVKLGSMGEYGTPDCAIPEGEIPEDNPQCVAGNCPMKDLQFPRKPGSFYHLSKVFDSQNIEFACRVWGLRSTDIMQGVVFGTRTDEIDPFINPTRFDYDEYFGTVINRFCAQAIAGIPLTVYGNGSQTRGYLRLKDSVECLRLAIENPPENGEYRVFNQFDQTHSINRLADMVCKIGIDMGLNTSIQHIANPRVEDYNHTYNPVHTKLQELGHDPHWSLNNEIADILQDLLPHKDRINPKVILPKTNWV